MRYIKNLRSTKSNLRAKYKKYRKCLSNEKKQSFDKKIAETLFSLESYINSSIIFTYVSKPLEVDTIGIIKQAFKDNKSVAVPRCLISGRLMNFHLIKSLDDLEHGTFGVLEPIVSKCTPIKDFSNGLCIVPGFAFDHDGYRIGYGKGYYDRFLIHFNGTTVGLCYNNCISSCLPHGAFDKTVDFIITERNIFATS